MDCFEGWFPAFAGMTAVFFVMYRGKKLKIFAIAALPKGHNDSELEAVAVRRRKND